jgi:hypothetical protein
LRAVSSPSSPHLPPIAHRRLSLIAGIVALFALSLLSCGREITGPHDGVGGARRTVTFALAPQFSGVFAGSSLVSERTQEQMNGAERPREHEAEAVGIRPEQHLWQKIEERVEKEYQHGEHDHEPDPLMRQGFMQQKDRPA